jgi:hypothetical protein
MSHQLLPLERRNILLSAVKEKMPVLEELLSRVQRESCGEDGIYRYYHQSFKVYGLQIVTTEIVSALKSILPDQPLTDDFMTIIQDGTGMVFVRAVNSRLRVEGRSILEAFFHARYFLEMAVKYGQRLELIDNINPSLEEYCSMVPFPMPIGFAALLELFDMR